MEVHVVGDDPIASAVTTALADVDVDVREVDAASIEDARFAVVADVTGSDTFAIANEAALAGNTAWIAVEVGGVGGFSHPEIDASVAGFSPSSGCFECLRARVASNRRDEDDQETVRVDRSTARLAGAIAGYECVRLFAGDREASIIGRVHEVPRTRRRFLPVPGCDCDAGERARTIDRDDDVSMSLEAAVAAVENAIDERVGIVATLGEVESFPAPYYLATAADTRAFSDARAPPQSAGVADDWNAAMMKAVGEALERYCAGVYREGDFVRASAADLEETVSPADAVKPDDAPPFDGSEEHRWLPGENLATGEDVHVHASLVQFPQPGDELVPSITTGLGLGSSSADALVSGLTEVVERDAAMLSWYSTFEPLELVVDDEAFETLARRARGEGLVVTPLLVTQDVDVPVVTVAVHRALESGDEAWPAFAVGSAADLDAAVAARSALEEALQNWMELRSLGPEEALEESGAIGEYAAFPRPVQEFVDASERVPAATVGPDPTPEGAAALETLVDRTVDAGLTPYAVRLTTRDVEALGFEAVRVVVPEAQPLFTDEAFFGERARRVPDALGFEPRLERDWHPYP